MLSSFSMTKVILVHVAVSTRGLWFIESQLGTLRQSWVPFINSVPDILDLSEETNLDENLGTNDRWTKS